MMTFKPERLQNEEEKRFYEAFTEFTDLEISRIVTGTLDGRTPKKFLNEDEIKLASSTIQWLGTPVGQRFLKNLGYKKL
jgi:hypothetical protein